MDDEQMISLRDQSGEIGPDAVGQKPEDTIAALSDPALDPLFFRAERLGAPSAWWQHVPFAHWLVNVCAPRVLVELGTHAGVSYTAFCGAVVAGGFGTRCYAVDTWLGDAQAGEYGEDVYEEFRRFHNQHYASFSTLLRSTFDEALGKITDGSIDILHIDGLHTFDAVRHDFDCWKPKLSDRAVVLFHDSNEHDGDFGVWRLFAELRKRYPNFEFSHGHGLGLLAVGEHAPPPVLALCAETDAAKLGRVRERFARLGERWWIETHERMVQAAAQDHMVTAASQKEDARLRYAALMQDLVAARAQTTQSLQSAALLEREKSLVLAYLAETERLAAHYATAQTLALRERDLVLSSTSWRVTAPLRAAARRAARVRGASASAATPNAMPNGSSAASESSSPSQAGVSAPQIQTGVNHQGALPTLGSFAIGRQTLPRLTWISGEPRTPGHQYRVMRHIAAAATAGARPTWLRTEEVAPSLRAIAESQVLFLWRTPWDSTIATAVEAARQGGAKVVFDIDDLMFEPQLAHPDIIDGIRTQGFLAENVRAHYAQIKSTMEAADLCLATTEELAHRMRRLGKPALVLANTFDEKTWHQSRVAVRQRAAERKDGLVRIGYAGGSRTHQRDLDVCIGAVAELLRLRPECRLVLFRDGKSNVPCVDVKEYPALLEVEDRIEWRDLVSLEWLPLELARFDINLAPLEVGNPFCEAKSELKFFEAALVSVPTIASPTGPYRRAIREGVTGFLPSTSAEWLDRLTSLADDADLRQQIAARARLDVLWRFGPERHAREFGRILEVLQGGSIAARAFEVAAQHRGSRQLPTLPSDKPELLFEADSFGSADVTVIIPLYNYAHTVEEALESVRAQTTGLLDLIVVDDCSTDDSVNVALSWMRSNASRFNRALLARNRVNQGLGASRNTGFALAETLWVMPLDADNRLRPTCISACMQAARASGAAFVYPSLQCFGDHNEIWGDCDWDPIRLSNGNYIDGMALISRAAWVEVGGYDLVRTGWEDFDLWCRFAERGLWGKHVPGEPLVEYRVHGTSMIKSAMRQHDEVRWMMRHLTKNHPWLTLVPPVAYLVTGEKPKLDRPVAASGSSRLAWLLSLLRCPETGTRLVAREDGESLAAEDGRHRWPIVQGRPVLFPGMDVPDLVPDSHLSNPLPESAVELIKSTKGPILHLSAGGSSERIDHVLEVEAAIFRHTDIVADVHRLPFADEVFDAVIALNAFEHYRDPKQAAREIFRVLRPGGRVLIRTAFLQPQHEAPAHFYNCTRYGLELWFDEFETDRLWVSDNFHAGYSLSWLASECEAALRNSGASAAADRLLAASIGQIAGFWRTPDSRPQDPVWADLAALPQQAQEIVAAGFEYIGRRPGKPGRPDHAIVDEAAEVPGKP